MLAYVKHAENNNQRTKMKILNKIIEDLKAAKLAYDNAVKAQASAQRSKDETFAVLKDTRKLFDLQVEAIKELAEKSE